jgi:hypothetical protein
MRRWILGMTFVWAMLSLGSGLAQSGDGSAPMNEENAAWVYDHPDYVPGKFGMGLRFNWSASRLFLRAPGCFPLKQGTVQMWVSTVQDLAGLDVYGPLMSVAPTAREHHHSQLILCLLPGRDRRSIGSNGLAAIIRSRQAGRVQQIPLDWRRGEWHAVALTWGGGGLSLYVDGKRIDHTNGPISLDEAPELISFGGGLLTRYQMSAQSVLDEIEISDCERSLAQIQAYAAGNAPRRPDEHTIFLNACEPTAPQGVQQMSPPLRQAQPVAAQSGSDFLDGYRLFDVGNRIGLPVWLTNLTTECRSFAIEAAVTSHSGEAVTSLKRRVDVPAGPPRKIVLSPEVSQPGWYQYRLKVVCDGKVLHDRDHAFAVIDPPASGLNSRNHFLGHHLARTRNTGVFRRCGIGWERSMVSFSWRTVEPAKGRFDWREPDYTVAEAMRHDVRLVGILGLTPAWAGRIPANQKDWKNQAGAHRRSAFQPRDLGEFRHYVFQTVHRYKGRVRHWEIWNEPDWNRPAGSGVQFMGADQDYLELLKTAYDAAKQADPDCYVLSGGMTPHEHLLKYLADHDGLRYFDILGMHRYRPWSDFLRYAAMVNGKCESPKPVWQSEKQVLGPSDALMEIQTARLHGLDKYFLFDLNGSCFEEYDWSPKPVTYATALYANKTAGKRVRKRIQFGRLKSLLSGILFEDEGGEQLATIGFNYKGPNELSIAFEAPAGEMIRVTGSMGETRCVVGEGARPIVVPVHLMAYIEGHFRPESFRVAQFEEKSCLLNASFRDVDGDFGFDGLRGMTLRHWTFRHKKGRVYLDKRQGNEQRKLVLDNPGNGRVYAFQSITLAGEGDYEISARFRRETETDTVRPYIAVYDRGKRLMLLKKIWPSLGTTYQRLHETLTFRNPFGERRELAVIFGSVDGTGRLFVTEPEVRRAELTIDPAKTLVIDLRPYANQTFEDESANDGRGGWADMGRANLSLIQTGPRAIAGKIFNILAPPGNTCLILGGNSRKHLPRSVTGIKIGAKVRGLNFLHTAMYVKQVKGQRLGRYVMRYEDGSQMELALIRGQNIDDWHLPAVTPGLPIAQKVYSPATREYALFTATWSNPHPDKTVASLDFISESNAALALVALSGEK